jgi:hypothetical protein
MTTQYQINRPAILPVNSLRVKIFPDHPFFYAYSNIDAIFAPAHINVIFNESTYPNIPIAV